MAVRGEKDVAARPWTKMVLVVKRGLSALTATLARAAFLRVSSQTVQARKSVRSPSTSMSHVQAVSA